MRKLELSPDIVEKLELQLILVIVGNLFTLARLF